MTVFNGVAEFGFQELLARRLTTPGGLPAPSCAPEMFPTIVLENDRPEWGYIKSERLCAAGGNVAAVAAQASAITIDNPVGSSMLLTVDQIGVNPAASTVQIILGANSLALTPVTGAVRDSRWIPSGVVGARPVAAVAQGTTLAAPPEALIARLAPSTTSIYTQPIVLGPGRSLIVICSTVNIAITNWWLSWRERRAQPGELV